MTRTLAWVRPSRWSTRWELREGARVLLRLETRPLLGTPVAFHADPHRWELRREGLFRPTYRLMDEAGRELASMRARASGRAELDTATGARLSWRGEGILTRRWIMEDEAGRTLATLRNRLDGSSEVVLEEHVPDGTLLPALALSWLAQIAARAAGVGS